MWPSNLENVSNARNKQLQHRIHNKSNKQSTSVLPFHIIQVCTILLLMQLSNLEVKGSTFNSEL